MPVTNAASVDPADRKSFRSISPSCTVKKFKLSLRWVIVKHHRTKPENRRINAVETGRRSSSQSPINRECVDLKRYLTGRLSGTKIIKETHQSWLVGSVSRFISFNPVMCRTKTKPFTCIKSKPRLSTSSDTGFHFKDELFTFTGDAYPSFFHFTSSRHVVPVDFAQQWLPRPSWSTV